MFTDPHAKEGLPCGACLNRNNILFVMEAYDSMPAAEQAGLQKELKGLFARFNEWDAELKEALGYFDKAFLLRLGINP